MINPDYTIEEIEARFFNNLTEKFGSFSVVEHLEQMNGGFEAYLYRFKITAIEDFGERLVLRLFPSYSHPESANWQTMIHNLLREEGLPVPRVYMATSDTSILGGSFLVMDYIDGEAIDPVEDPSVLVLAAKTQAMLHQKDGGKISEAIKAKGHSAESHTFEGRIQWIIRNGKKYPGLDEAVQWLISNRPDEPMTLKIIHGDFHPMNLLVKDGEVAAILDWSGFMVGDPMYGLGWTKALFIATGKPELPEDVYNRLVKMYTEAYESISPIDYEKVDYYVVYRLVRAIIEGKEGQEIWTQPAIVNYIIKEIEEMTGIRVEI